MVSVKAKLYIDSKKLLGLGYGLGLETTLHYSFPNVSTLIKTSSGVKSVVMSVIQDMFRNIWNVFYLFPQGESDKDGILEYLLK